MFTELQNKHPFQPKVREKILNRTKNKLNISL